MVLFSIPATLNSAEFVDTLKRQNILLQGGSDFRAVTHYWITAERVRQVVDTVSAFMALHLSESEYSAPTVM
jgi:hypothetical protein